MVRLREVSCDDARAECGDKETSITLLFREVIRASSVITLTVGVYVDAHDYRAPALRRIATRAVADYGSRSRAKGMLVTLHSEFCR
jgi:hypothetical protein